MKFTKQELSFMDLFSTISDTKHPLNDKFQIQTTEDKVVFSCFGNSIGAISVLDNKDKDTISRMYSIPLVNQMVKLSDNDKPIEITNEHISIGKSKYEFEMIDGTLDQTNSILEVIEQQQPVSKFKIVDVDKLLAMKNYIGSAEGLDTVLLTNTKFIASNRTDAIAVYDSTNDKNLTMYLPRIILNILMTLKIKEIQLIKYANFMTMQIGSTYIVFLDHEEGYYIVPNILTNDYKMLYEFDTNIQVNRKDLMSALQRLLLILQDDKDSKVFITLSETEIEVEGKSKGHGSEKITAVISKELVGNKLILSARYAVMILSSLEGETATVKIGGDDSISVAYVDEKSDKFFVQLKCQDVEI